MLLKEADYRDDTSESRPPEASDGTKAPSPAETNKPPVDPQAVASGVHIPPEPVMTPETAPTPQNPDPQAKYAAGSPGPGGPQVPQNPNGLNAPGGTGGNGPNTPTGAEPHAATPAAGPVTNATKASQKQGFVGGLLDKKPSEYSAFEALVAAGIYRYLPMAFRGSASQLDKHKAAAASNSESGDL